MGWVGNHLCHSAAQSLFTDLTHEFRSVLGSQAVRQYSKEAADYQGCLKPPSLIVGGTRLAGSVLPKPS